jgi:hypothetical protein
MTIETSFQVHQVIGPEGLPLTLNDLPPSHLKRWISRRKAEVVTAVDGGLITRQEACERYGLSREELLQWERGFKAYGMAGLRATKLAGRNKIARSGEVEPKLMESSTSLPAPAP